MLNKNLYLYKLCGLGAVSFSTFPIATKLYLSFNSTDKQNLISEPQNKQKQTPLYRVQIWLN